MEAVKLEAKTRQVTGKQVSQLRGQGVVPAVVYGHGVESRNLALDYGNLEKLLRTVSESTLIDLAVNGESPVKVLIQEVQRDPLKGTIKHVDFRQVKMTEKLEAEIEFNFVGEAPAVRELGAILVRNMNGISVRCLPQYLVSSIEIDLSGLKKFHDSVKVSDIKPPEGVEFLAEPNAIVVSVTEPISEAELAELEAKPEMDVNAVKSEADEKKEAAAAAEAVEEKKE
jgi:large subunit ribosomal protein L25